MGWSRAPRRTQRPLQRGGTSAPPVAPSDVRSPGTGIAKRRPVNPARWIPAWEWARSYRREDLGGDLSAGLTVAVMLVPQGMAYAMLAGLPPIVGLYASIVPLVVYALFGSSRQLAVGPVAMVSLLVASGVSPLARPGTDAYVALAVVLAALVGLVTLAMGVLRLGFVVRLLSHPVVSGFTSAAALIIGLSQLKHLLGIPLPRGKVHEILIAAAGQLHATHLATLALGAGAIAVLLVVKRRWPAFPGALLVVVSGTALVSALGLEAAGVRVVGEVPAGLPAPSLPELELAMIPKLLPTALVIALVGFMESVSVAKVFAQRNGYRIDANRELVGLGLANLAGALFGGYPVTGGFSRTAVNAAAGARTGLAAILTAGLIALALVFLTPAFHDLPVAVLAAIIMVAVFGLIDLREVRHLWHTSRADLVLLVVTFVATLLAGIEEGIGIGVLASLGLTVLRAARPHVAELGRLPGTEHFRNLARFPEAERVPGAVVLRFDGPLQFANADTLRDTIEGAVAAAGPTLSAVVLDASAITDLDATGAAQLGELADALSARGVALKLCSVTGPVRDRLHRHHLHTKLGAPDRDRTVADALVGVAPTRTTPPISSPAESADRGSLPCVSTP